MGNPATPVLTDNWLQFIRRHHYMRLWTVHPKYLDAQGLVALWREALLARAVLRNQTRGYKHHPQLERFQSHPSPRLAINGSGFMAEIAYHSPFKSAPLSGRG